jgi:malonyl-CoA/methylmalonyl-CoA synthetase
MELPYVDEAVVVGVEDAEFGQRVGAILSIKNGEELSIQQLRASLQLKLASYKMPTLLRLVQGELPKGGTGKVQKKILGPQLLPSPGWQNEKQVQAWRRAKPVMETARL